VVPINPLMGIQTMVTRRDMFGQPVNLAEGIPLEDALRAYTVNGAYASFEEGLKGTLQHGMLGDVTVFDADLAQVAPEDLAEVPVAFTIADGNVVYSA
jgi:predicted amidohydrolase YtcJ